MNIDKKFINYNLKEASEIINEPVKFYILK